MDQHKRNIWEGFLSAVLAGFAGAILVNEFAWSLLAVGLLGIVIGLVVEFSFYHFRRIRNK